MGLSLYLLYPIFRPGAWKQPHKWQPELTCHHPNAVEHIDRQDDIGDSRGFGGLEVCLETTVQGKEVEDW